jgi:hypothetical protein
VPSTVNAVVLLGWMERDFAVKYLMQECVFDPPLTELQAEEMWRRYHDQIQALPERAALAPQRLPMTATERKKADIFLRFHGLPQRIGSIQDVIKVNPMNLVIHQPFICVDRVQQHLAGNDGCDPLSTDIRAHPVTIHSGINAADIHVPHGEFAFLYDLQRQQFTVSETGRHVSVTQFQNRMILWAGYHRSYACMVRENPDGIERSLLVALTTDADFFVSEHSPNQGLRAVVCGLRPPLFADFFDERFFMAVKLRKKRYELQIRAQCVPVNFD